ncbi:hypothetical protein HAX54_052500, partial [Datura stramonium]|nr:hypothetical protein [Datura stramonium]
MGLHEEGRSEWHGFCGEFADDGVTDGDLVGGCAEGEEGREKRVGGLRLGRHKGGWECVAAAKTGFASITGGY